MIWFIVAYVFLGVSFMLAAHGHRERKLTNGEAVLAAAFWPFIACALLWCRFLDAVTYPEAAE